MFYCPVCNEELILMSSLCSTCKKLKYYIQLYSRDKVINILDNVLSRTDDKIENKEKALIKEEIEGKKNILNNHIKRGTLDN